MILGILAVVSGVRAQANEALAYTAAGVNEVIPTDRCLATLNAIPFASGSHGGKDCGT
jgi:hypothetical protein